MAGGLIQLLAWGNQNIKLNGNPSITFFKKVRKSHSNFSMESIRVNLNRTDANVYSNTIYKAKLERHGDLVQQVYFVFEIPDIAPNEEGFRWVENFAEVFIDNYYINIGGALVDKQYGEQLHLNNMLTFNSDKRKMYDNLIGNVDELVYPDKYEPYPSHTPALKSRKIYVPLNLWFNRDTSSALPLICLQYSDTEITIETRPFTDLYKVRGNAPSKTTTKDTLSQFVYNELNRYMVSDSVVDIKAYLEVNYYFVDTLEREYIAFNSHEYLVEQTMRIERFGLTTNNIFEMVLQNPVKEFIWVLKRNDMAESNNWFDFTDKGRHIMKSAKILFNGMDRIDEKDAIYFNYVQPYQHHTGNGKDGVYVYSFSISPEDLNQPSGSCNMSRINRVQMMIQTGEPLNENYKYDLTLYAINYNFLKISSGLAGIVFSS
jgi:hypothetical protein